MWFGVRASAEGESSTRSRSECRGDLAVLGAIAAVDLAMHLALSGRYGYWIDELYFIACGEHLAWGYVDHPPLIAVVAKLSRLLLGDSLLALRLLPALSIALLVLLTGWMARAFGGGRAAQVIAAVAAFVVPAFAVFGSVLTTNSFEPLFWMSCAYLTIRMAQGVSPRLWLALGAVAGVGLLNKHSMAFFAAALVAGLLLSPQRRLLWNRCFWLGGLVTVLIAAPHLLWQARHGWPTVELLANAHRFQHQPVTPLEFVWGQIQIIHPFLFPVWIAGLYFFLADARGARFRFLGWTFVVLFLTFLSVQAKTYYLAPVYPMLLAAGGVVIEQAMPAARRVRVTSGVVAILLLGWVAIAPYVLPILPIHLLPRYMDMLGVKEVRPETRPMGNVPQIFADMLGSEELVAEVARVYAGLTPDERHHAVLWGRDFGVAGAIDYFGRAYGLPRAISGHQNYYLWRPPGQSGELMIAVGIPEQYLLPWFTGVESVGTVRCDLCMPDRQVMHITVCRGLKVPLDEFWPLVKCWTCYKPRFVSERPPGQGRSTSSGGDEMEFSDGAAAQAAPGDGEKHAVPERQGVR
jgi:hypothetical protein